jgi:hypothetical protein
MLPDDGKLRLIWTDASWSCLRLGVESSRATHQSSEGIVRAMYVFDGSSG